MAATIYNLYLDESLTYRNNTQEDFCIVGIIVSQNLHDGALTTELNNLKQTIWGDLQNPTDLILHEKEVKQANRGRGSNSVEYQRFKNNRRARNLYAELNKIIDNNDVQIIAVSISKDKLNAYYPSPLRHNDEWTIAI